MDDIREQINSLHADYMICKMRRDEETDLRRKINFEEEMDTIWFMIDTLRARLQMPPVPLEDLEGTSKTELEDSPRPCRK
jgi:hypothetical protein